MEIVERFHCQASVRDRLHLMTGLFEHRADEVGDVTIVIYDENPATQRLAPRCRCGFLVQHV